MNKSEEISKESFKGITGYGEDADNLVRQVVVKFVKALEENPNLNPGRKLEKVKGLKVYPPMYKENSDLKKLKNLAFVDGGMSGAMFESGISLGMFWYINGHDTFIKKLREVVKK